MAKIEFEAKVLEIDKNVVRKRLRELGATLVFPEKLFTRATFDNPELRAKNAWIRVRDEGDRFTMAFKIVSDESKITGMREVQLEVDSMEKAGVFLEQLGLKQKNFQQNKREEWELDGVVFDIDTWPSIPPYLEIEAKDEDTVSSWFEKLGFDYSKAVFGSTDVVYSKFYGKDILTMEGLIFEELK